MKILEKNVIDLIVYADSKRCALLNEATMPFVLKNKAVAHRIAISDIVPESCTLFAGLMAAINLQDLDEAGNSCYDKSTGYER